MFNNNCNWEILWWKDKKETFKINPFKINPFKINPFKINPFKINPFKINPFTLIVTKTLHNDSSTN